MSVNLSGKQLAQPHLVERIKEVLHETQIKACHLKLEVTESVVMEHPEVAAVTLARLRGLGLLLSIDDFGTGYSSLSYLNRFPLDILKIDRSFISTMNKSDENLQIVKTINKSLKYCAANWKNSILSYCISNSSLPFQKQICWMMN